MEVILLENVRNVGKFGNKVNVAKGYGRNFLIPQGKAVPATKENLLKFEADRTNLEKVVKERLQAAQDRAAEINQLHIKIEARVGDKGKLFGSIGTIELVKAFKDNGVEVERQEIRLPHGAIRDIGEYEVEVQLHAEVVAQAKVSIVAEEENN
jgi:large subunit ribosomal protein L9